MLLKKVTAAAGTSSAGGGGRSDNGPSHTMVVVRVRPENSKEVSVGYPRRVVEVLSDSSLIFDPRLSDDAPQFCPGEQIREERQRAADRSRLLHFRRREKNMTFNFDRVFSDQVQNEEVYENTTATMIDSFLNGFNCSVFCYGATGAGKTFTMLGGKGQSGVIFFTMRNLYDRVSELMQNTTQYNVKVSYLEIYNEQVRDLLAKWNGDYLDDDKFEAFLNAKTADRQSEVQSANNPIPSTAEEPNSKRPRYGATSKSSVSTASSATASSSGTKPAQAANKRVPSSRAREDGNDLLLLEDAQVGVVVQGITYHEPASAEELMRMLAYGNLQRTQHPTDANSESSRSHAVFQVYFRQKALNGQPSKSGCESMTYRAAKFSLIDLAGSERATATSNNGMRFREGANINKSLLALGNCINALADGKKAAHIPYRNSKLTRLLKDSLGGNCQTCMIAAVSPSATSYEDTYNTLKYADRARAIRVDIRQNVVNAAISNLDLSKIVESLRRENAQLRSQLERSVPMAPLSHTTEATKTSSVSHTARANVGVGQRPASTVAQAAQSRGAAAPELPVLDQTRARLFERDLRLMRKLECWRRLKVLGLDPETTDVAHDRLVQFIDANYLEQTNTNVLVCSTLDQASTKDGLAQPEANLTSLVNLIGALSAETDEDKQLVRELLALISHFYGLLKCEHLVTQSDVDSMEKLKQRILTFENTHSRQYRHPLTRGVPQQNATKREACGVRWAERLEVEEPRKAYFDEPDDDDVMHSSQDEQPFTTSIADHQDTISALPNIAQRIRGLDAKALSRAFLSNSVRSLFVLPSANASDASSKTVVKKGPLAMTSTTTANSLSKPRTHALVSTSTASKGPTSMDAASNSNSLASDVGRRAKLVVDEVDRVKKSQTQSSHETADKQSESAALSTKPAYSGSGSTKDADATFVVGSSCASLESTFILSNSDGNSYSKNVGVDEEDVPISVVERHSKLLSKIRDSMMVKRGHNDANRIDEEGSDVDEDEHEELNGTFTVDEEEPTEPAPSAVGNEKSKTSSINTNDQKSSTAGVRRALKRTNTLSPPGRRNSRSSDESGACPNKQIRVDGAGGSPSISTEKPTTGFGLTRGTSSSNLRAAQRDPPRKLRRFTSATNCIASTSAGATSSPPVASRGVSRPGTSTFMFRQTISDAVIASATASSASKTNSGTLTSITNHSAAAAAAAAASRPLLRAHRSTGRAADDNTGTSTKSQNSAPATTKRGHIGTSTISSIAKQVGKQVAAVSAAVRSRRNPERATDDAAS